MRTPLLNATIPANVTEPTPSVGSPIRIEVDTVLKSMAPLFGSLNPISNRDLTRLSDLELSELGTALDLELLHAIVNGQPDRRSILEEFSPALSSILSGGN